MDLKDKMLIAGLVTTWAGILLKMKAFESWLEEFLKRWADRRSAPAVVPLAIPVPDLVTKAAASGRNELQTLVLWLKQEYRADRVTVMEYSRDPTTKALLGTILEEERSARMPSVLAAFQRAPLLPEIEAEVLRIHAQELHCLFVPVARLVELPAMRVALVESAVSSAYYQTLPASGGHAGGLLSISWKDEQQLTARDLEALHFSGISLGGVLRMLWELRPPEKL